MIHLKTERKKDRKEERQKGRKEERQKDRKTERQKDRKTERQKGRLIAFWEIESFVEPMKQSVEQRNLEKKNI